MDLDSAIERIGDALGAALDADERGVDLTEDDVDLIARGAAEMERLLDAADAEEEPDPPLDPALLEALLALEERLR